MSVLSEGWNITTWLSSPPSIDVVEGVEHDVELSDEGQPELAALDVAVVRHNLSRRIELQHGLFGHQRLVRSRQTHHCKTTPSVSFSRHVSLSRYVSLHDMFRCVTWVRHPSESPEVLHTSARGKSMPYPAAMICVIHSPWIKRCQSVKSYA